MFLHIGGDCIVYKKDIIAIFDLESTSLSKITKEYLKNEEINGRVINVEKETLPKSYIVTNEKGKNILYISPIASATLLKRAR
jgi:hypothetical protein